MRAIMDPKIKEELSASNFQQKIFDWFDRRGMLSELRSYLRHQMITAFQNSSMGKSNPTGRFTVENPISPALQAFLLLVAEFLAQQEYHYTVSILVAEVPMLATFPKFAAHVSHLSDSQSSIKNENLPKYSEKDVLDILETLGIEPESESGLHIVRLYLDSAPRESLLACILTALPAVANAPSKPGIEPSKDPENLTYYIEEIRLLLLRAQLDKNQLKQLDGVLRRFHTSAAAKARQEERERCMKEAETNNQQLRLWESAARQRQRDAEVELETSKRQLKEVTAQLRVQHDDILRRLQRVQKHAEEVRIKEEKVEAAKYENEQLRNHLDAKNEKLIVQQARLQEGFRSLQEERENLQTLRAEMQGASLREKVYISSISEQKEICAKLQTELEKTRVELNEVRMELKSKIQLAVEPCHGAVKDVACRSTQTEAQRSPSSSSSVAEPASSSSSSEVQPPLVQSPSKKEDRQSGLGTLNVVRHLRQENAELQERSVQLQRRLEEVTEQAAVWASSSSRLIEPRPLAPPPPPAPRRVARSQDLGAGEELGHPPVRQPVPNRDHTLHLHGREWKRTAPKQLLVHVEPSDYPSSDESVSEEVLRETGRRLRHLDAESKLLDRRRRELKESSLTNTASYMFIPTAITPTLPTPAAARPYEPGNLVSRLFPEKLSSSVNFGLHDSTLGRYSQVTWPDVPGTSTPLRMDSSLRRGIRSHLSLARNLVEPEERRAASPLRTTERNAFLRLDAALDNIKLARENIQLGAEPVESVQVEDTRGFRPETEFESPSHIRDRVMATLRAAAPAAGLIAVTSSDPVPTPAAGLFDVPSPAAVPTPAASGLITVPSRASIPASAISGLITKPDIAPVSSLAGVSMERFSDEKLGEREKQPVDTSPYRVSSMTPAPGVSAEPTGRREVQPIDVTPPYRISSVTPAMPAKPQGEPEKQAVDVTPPYRVSSMTSAPAFGAISDAPPGERDRQPVDMTSPYRISSLTMPELPLAPPVILEKTGDSPKDSTLNEISTPASSPSMPGNLENLILEDVAKSISAADPKKGNSLEDLEFGRKPSGSAEKAAEILPLKSDTASQNVLTTASPLRSSQPPKTNADARGKAAEILSLTSDALSQNVATSGFPPLRSFQPPLTNAGPFAEGNFQPSRNTFKDDEVLDEASSSSNESRISVGSNSDIQKDDSW